MPPGRRTNKSDSRAQINEFNYYTDPGSNRILSDPGRDSDMSLRDDVEENQMNRYSSQQYSVIEIPVTFPQAISPEASYNTQSSSQVPTRDNVQQHSFPLDVRDDSGEFMEIYSENRYQDNYSFAPSDFNFDGNQQQFNTSQELHIGVNQQDRCYQPSEVQFLSQQQTHYESQQHMESIIQQMSNQSISQPHPGEQQPQGSMVLPSSISQQRIRGSRRSLISSRMTTEQQLGIQQRHKRPSHHQINQQQQFVVGRQCSSMHPSMQNRTQQQENEQLQFQQIQMQIRLSSPIGSSYASPVQDQNQISTSSVHQSNQINRGFVYPGNSSSCCLSSESGPSRGHNREIPISHPSQCVYINYNQNPRLGYLYGSDHSNSSLNSSNHHRPSSIQSSHTQRSPISPFRLVTSPIQPIRSEEDSQFASPRAASSSMEWQRMIVQRNNICTRVSIENQNGQQFLIHHQSSNYNQQYQPPHPQQIHDEVAGQIPVQCLSEEVIQQDFQSRAITPIPVLSFEVIDETFGQIQIEQLTHQSIESPISDSLEQLIHDEIDQRVQELHAQDIRRNEFQQATSDAAAVSNFEPSTIFPIEEPYGVHEFSSSEDSPVPSVMPQPAPEFEKVNIPLAPMRRNLWSSSSSEDESLLVKESPTPLPSSEDPKGKKSDNERSSGKSSREKKEKKKKYKIAQLFDSSDSESEKKKHKAKEKEVKIAKEKKKKGKQLIFSSDEDHQNKKSGKEKISKIQKSPEKCVISNIPKIKKDFKISNSRRIEDEPNSTKKEKKKKDRYKSNDPFIKSSISSRSSLKDYTQPRQLPKWIEKSRPIPQKSRNSKALSALLKDREGAERLVATAQSVYPSTTVMARHGISRDYTTPRYFPKEAQKTTTPTLKSDFSQTRSQPRHFKSIQHLSSSSSVSKPVSQPSNFSLISPSKKMDSQLSVNKKPDSKTTTVKPTRPNPSLTANNSCGLSLEDIMGGMVFPSTPFEEIKKVMEAREAADRARVMKSEVARKEGRRSTETLEMTEVRKSKEFPKAKEIGRSVGVVKEKEIRPLLSPFKSYDTKKSVEASIPKTKSSEFDAEPGHKKQKDTVEKKRPDEVFQYKVHSSKYLEITSTEASASQHIPIPVGQLENLNISTKKTPHRKETESEANTHSVFQSSLKMELSKNRRTEVVEEDPSITFSTEEGNSNNVVVMETDPRNSEDLLESSPLTIREREAQESVSVNLEGIQLTPTLKNDFPIRITDSIYSSKNFDPRTSVKDIQDYKSVQSSISQSSELSSDKSDIPVPGPPPTMITSKDVQGNKDRSVHEVPFVNDSPGTSISNPTRRHSDNLLFGPPIKRPCSLIDNDEPNIFTEEDPFGFMASPVRTGEITLSEFIAFSAECDSSAEIIPLDMSLCSSTKIAENFRKPIDVNSEEKEINFTFPKNFYRELGSSDRYRSSRENQTTDPGTNVNHLFRDSKRTTKLNIGYEQELEKFSRFYETAVACTDGDIFKETYVGIASLSDFLQLTKVAVRWLKVRQVPILPFEDNIDEFEGLLPKPLRMFVSNEFPTKNVHEVVYGYSKFSRLELSALLSCYFLFEEIDQNPMISMNIAKFKFYTAKWRIVLRNRIEKNQYVHPLFVIWASATWETDRPFALIEFTRNIFKEEFKELEEAKKRLNPKMFQKRAFDVFIRKAKDMSGDLDSREIPFIVAAGRILNQMFQIQNPIEACKITRRLSYCLLKFRNSLSKKIKGYHLRKEDEEFWFSFFKGLYSEENGSKNNRKLKSKINELLENDHLDEEEEKILIIKFFNLIIGEIFPGITPPDIKDDLTLRNNGYIAYVIYLSNEVLKAWLQYYKFQEKTKSTDLTVFEEKFVFYDTFNPIAFKSDCLPEYQKFFEFRFLPKIDAVLSHLELEQLDSIMEILEIVSDKENGLDKKKREDRGNESEGTKGQKETSQVSREIYNSYISGKKIPEHSALAHLSLAQGEVKKKTIISKSLLSLVPKVLSNSSFQSKKKSKFIKNRESQEEIPLCAICDGKQTIIYNTPLSEMESFVESIKKGRKLENTVMLNTIWNKTRELNRDWVLNGRVIYQQSRALECVLDINNNDEPEGPDSRNNKLLNVVGSIIPYDIKETHILMKLCRYYFHSSCFDTAEQKFSFFLEEAVGNPFAI